MRLSRPPLPAEFAADLPAAASTIAGRFGDVDADLLPLVRAAGLEGVQAAELSLTMSMAAGVWW